MNKYHGHPVLEQFEVDFNRVPGRIEAQVGDASNRHTAIPNGTRNVQAADVLGHVGNHADDGPALRTLNEEQSRREYDHDTDHNEQAEPDVTVLCRQQDPP